MSEDLNISNTEPQADSELELEEGITDSDFIATAYNAISALDGYDPMTLAGKKQKAMIIKRCIYIIDVCTKNLYNLLTEEAEEDDD